MKTYVSCFCDTFDYADSIRSTGNFYRKLHGQGHGHTYYATYFNDFGHIDGNRGYIRLF